MNMFCGQPLDDAFDRQLGCAVDDLWRKVAPPLPQRPGPFPMLVVPSDRPAIAAMAQLTWPRIVESLRRAGADVDDPMVLNHAAWICIGDPRVARFGLQKALRESRVAVHAARRCDGSCGKP